MTAASASPKPVDPKLVETAMKALLDYHEKTSDEKKALLGSERSIQVQFGLERVPQNPSPKPIRIGIPHSLWRTDDKADDGNLQEPEVCLIVKETSKPWVQELIQQFPEHLGFVKKVLGLDSLRKKHGSFEQQRFLLGRFDLFMADDRILPMVGKAIGRNFFRAKKQPIPISLTRKNSVPHLILQSLRSTFLFISEGTCLTIRAGNTAMDPKRLAENVMAIAQEVPLKVPHKWANIRSIAIKTTESTSLPIYNKTPQELQEIAKMAGLSDKPSEAVTEKRKRKNEAAQKEFKERKAKSPLVRALKRQKQMEDDSNKSTAAQTETKVDAGKEVAKDEKKNVLDEAKEEEQDTDKGNVQSQSPEKKRKVLPVDAKGSNNKGAKKNKQKKATPDYEEVANKSTDELEESSSSVKGKDQSKPADTKKTTPVRDEQTSKAEPKGKKAEKKVTPRESSTKQTTKPLAEDEKLSSRKSKPNEGKAAPFIRAKKYSGSKVGYVFRKGQQGLGYYEDVKPVVDQMMIDAMLRSANSNRGSGKHKKGKKKRGKR